MCPVAPLFSSWTSSCCSPWWSWRRASQRWFFVGCPMKSPVNPMEISLNLHVLISIASMITLRLLTWRSNIFGIAGDSNLSISGFCWHHKFRGWYMYNLPSFLSGKFIFVWPTNSETWTREIIGVINSKLLWWDLDMWHMSSTLWFLVWPTINYQAVDSTSCNVSWYHLYQPLSWEYWVYGSRNVFSVFRLIETWLLPAWWLVHYLSSWGSIQVGQIHTKVLSETYNNIKLKAKKAEVRWFPG